MNLSLWDSSIPFLIKGKRMAKISKDLCLRIDEVEYNNFQSVLDLFEAQDILYIGCDNGCALIDYSSEAVDMLMQSECINNNQGLEVKRLNPDKILIVIK
jgi:hypothetical protein